jgi:hypothetical protein
MYQIPLFRIKKKELNSLEEIDYLLPPKDKTLKKIIHSEDKKDH